MLPDEATDPSQALQLADERLYAQKYSRRGEGDRTMAALLEALSVRDPDLQAQLAGVGSLAGDIGRMLGLRRDELEELDRAAQLHDLGKLAVPDEILSKPGPLDEREWAFVRQHTIVGERILRASPALRSVATVVRASHENWDGSGYPDGLAGEDIPLASRIIRACNAFVAMTSNRPYREAFPVDEALNELMRCAGTRLRPERRPRPRRTRPGRAGSRASRLAGAGILGARGPVAQWIERQTSNLCAEVRLLPGPLRAARCRVADSREAIQRSVRKLVNATSSPLARSPRLGEIE